ncbi:MAG: metal ABC transporter ATP-binding protein [Actinomycetota bacterium]
MSHQDATNIAGLTITASHLDVGYGLHRVVRDINLQTQRGDLIALIGTNGSGKSTLLKSLAGMLPAMHGEVSVLGTRPGAAPKRVAYLPQHPVSSHTLPLRARDVVAMGRFAHLGLFKRAGAADREIVAQTMQRTGAVEFADKPLREMSGGQQQRTHLAQVLARNAELLLLDEPTAGLDIAGKVAVADIIAAERARGVTVVLATHDLADATSATAVMLLAQRVVAFGPPDVALSDANVRECFGFTQPH